MLSCLHCCGALAGAPPITHNNSFNPNQPTPMKQQQIKKLYFLIWLDCFLGAALSSTNFFSSARPLGRASWKEKKCCWWTAAISLLHQQPPVINQPSTCLISTYVCFLSIDILTVIILFNSIQFIKQLMKWMKWKRKVYFSFEWSEWSWLFGELPLHSKEISFLCELRVVSYRFSLHLTQINSTFTSFFNY